MKTLLVDLIILFLTINVNVSAQSRGKEGDKGIGIVLGDPTGITFKSWFNSKSAFDVAAAWTVERKDAFHIHASFLHHNYDFFNPNRGRMSLYFGVGGRLKIREDRSNVGVRIPLGTEYLFQGIPVGIFLEVAPIVNLVPSSNFDINSGIGVRYYFQSSSK
jgi:hypothetical protein